MVRRTWGGVGGWKLIWGHRITGRCVFVLQNKKGFQQTLVPWARVKAPIVCENPNFLADEISMLVVQNLCCSSTSSTFLVAKLCQKLFDINPKPPKRPGHCFWLHSWSPCHPMRLGPWHPVACPVAVGHPGWVRVPLPVGNSRIIPGGPWQLVHSWCSHGSDISTLNIT